RAAIQRSQASLAQLSRELGINPKTRKLIRVTIDEDEPGETDRLVDQLMGKKPELRFQYIQENARFVEELDV
ncbi:MAG: hypothetical protein WBN07_14530, partial [Woeseiaceae bacterium]